VAKKLVKLDGTDADLADSIVLGDIKDPKEYHQYMQEKGLRWEVEFTHITSERFMTQLTQQQRKMIAAFLRYSFEGIDYEYDYLTDREKTLGTKGDFIAITRWAREMED
jgi:hypothetical protein